MALRIRKNGKILCAVESKPKKNDVYIDDKLHYFLFQKNLIYTKNEGKTWRFKEVRRNE